jgi:hypothetical protein
MKTYVPIWYHALYEVSAGNTRHPKKKQYVVVSLDVIAIIHEFIV